MKVRTIVLLTGPHGCGKSTLAEALDRRGAAIRLRQYTMRPRRHKEHGEYRFVLDSPVDALWRYTKAGSEYGFSQSELASLPDGCVGVIAVHTEALDDLKESPLGIRVVTIGLDTLASRDDQLSRVDYIEGRIQSPEAFEKSRRIARNADVCLAGDFDAVLRELIQIIAQQRETA